MIINYKLFRGESLVTQDSTTLFQNSIVFKLLYFYLVMAEKFSLGMDGA